MCIVFDLMEYLVDGVYYVYVGLDLVLFLFVC